MSYSQLQRREIYSARESPRTSDSAHTQPAGRCCRRGGARSSQLCLPLALGCFLCPAASGLSSQPGSSQGAAVPAVPGPGCAEQPGGSAGSAGMQGRDAPGSGPGREPSPLQELSRNSGTSSECGPCCRTTELETLGMELGPGAGGCERPRCSRSSPGPGHIPRSRPRSAPGTDSPRCSCQQRFVFSSLTQIVTSHCRPELRDLINI